MKDIKVVVDKRTELMDVLLYISNYRKEYPNLMLFNRDINYVNDVYNKFSKFSDTQTVKLLNEIIEKYNFCYDAPYSLAMQLNDDFKMGELLPYPFARRLGSDSIVVDFMKSIKEFVEISGFEQFYMEHSDLYQRFIDKAKQAIDFKLLSKFEEFYKIDSDVEYIINLLPLCGRDGRGAFYDYRKDGEFVINFSNDLKGEFDVLVNYPLTPRIFHIFTLCYLRRIVDEGNIEVHATEEFDKILKTKYTAGTNLQYICEEIAVVLRAIFKAKYQGYDVQDALNEIKSQNRERINKIYDILKVWQKSNDCLETYLQQIFDLFW